MLLFAFFVVWYFVGCFGFGYWWEEYEWVSMPDSWQSYTTAILLNGFLGFLSFPFNWYMKERYNGK